MFEGKRLVHADDLVRARIDRVEVRKYFLIDVFYFITAHGRHPSTLKSLFCFCKTKIRSEASLIFREIVRNSITFLRSLNSWSTVDGSLKFEILINRKYRNHCKIPLEV